jgi:hypothetical protein
MGETDEVCNQSELDVHPHERESNEAWDADHMVIDTFQRTGVKMRQGFVSSRSSQVALVGDEVYQWLRHFLWPVNLKSIPSAKVCQHAVSFG